MTLSYSLAAVSAACEESPASRRYSLITSCFHSGDCCLSRDVFLIRSMITASEPSSAALRISLSSRLMAFCSCCLQVSSAIICACSSLTPACINLPTSILFQGSRLPISGFWRRSCLTIALISLSRLCGSGGSSPSDLCSDSITDSA